MTIPLILKKSYLQPPLDYGSLTSNKFVIPTAAEGPAVC
jgi:hypothetical protein